MRIVFMGTPEFAVPTLKKIIENNHTVIAVVTKEDKPQGRGHKVEFTPVKYLAIESDLNILQPTNVKDTQFINTLKMLNPDVIVVVAYGKILPKAILDIPRYGCINVHASLLPKYRGAAPIQYAVLNGDKYTGVTTMFMDVGMDTGDMLLSAKVEITDKDTAGTMHDKLSHTGAETLIETLNQLEAGTLKRIKQNEEEATYTKMIEKSMGLVNWNKKSIEILNMIRGLSPWPSAYTFYQEKMMKIWDAEDYAKTYPKNGIGEIVELDENGIIVKTEDGSMKITKIQMQDAKAMSVKEYKLGHEIKIGEKLELE